MIGTNSIWLEFLLYKCFILDSCTSSWEFLEMTAPDDSFRWLDSIENIFCQKLAPEATYTVSHPCTLAFVPKDAC